MAKKRMNVNVDAQAIRDSKLINQVLVGDMRMDGVEDASVFFARELDHVKAKSYDRLYPEMTSFSLFPHTSDADPGDETITAYSFDRIGIAQIINNYATDMPRADVKGKPFTSQIKSIGASYGYSVQELRASRKSGKGLDHRRAESAKYAVDYVLNKIAWAGDPENNLMGVLTPTNNIPYKVVDGAVNGAGQVVYRWKDKTADQILADINGFMGTVSRNTKNVERPDTLGIPTDVFIDIATRRIPDTSTTVKDFVLEHAPYLKDIVPCAELNADSYETNPLSTPDAPVNVAFFFTKDADKFAVEDPMPYLQHTVQERNLEMIVPVEARTAGVIIYYPMSALIVAGI